MTLLSIRKRMGTDFPALVEVVKEVHLNDHWPKCRPDDWPAWLQIPKEKTAWVVEANGIAVGHVSVATPPATTSMNSFWQTALKQDPTAMIEISRLFISPKFRGLGGGALLFETAVTYTASTNLEPVLYTGEVDLAAQRMYERNGWKRVGEIPEFLPDGTTMVMLAYVLNAPASAYSSTII